MCKVENLSITEPGVTITSVNGEIDTPFKANDIKLLFVEDRTVNYFPLGLENFFPNLEGIQISDANLTSVSQVDLKPFPKLRRFFVNFNNIETLDDGLFDFNPELEDINFDNNKLKKISGNILASLTKLKSAQFTDNVCVHKYAHKKEEIPVLVSIFIEKC